MKNTKIYDNNELVGTTIVLFTFWLSCWHCIEEPYATYTGSNVHANRSFIRFYFFLFSFFFFTCSTSDSISKAWIWLVFVFIFFFCFLLCVWVLFFLYFPSFAQTKQTNQNQKQAFSMQIVESIKWIGEEGEINRIPDNILIYKLTMNSSWCDSRF